MNCTSSGIGSMTSRCRFVASRGTLNTSQSSTSISRWQSSGKVLELLRALKAKEGDRQKKLFQFLNELGARTLRIHIGRVLEMTESSDDRYGYEKKIIDRFGGQHELDLIVPPAPPPQSVPAAQ